MRVSQRFRKLLLSTHLAVSVGWIGALAAYLALDLTTVVTQDPATLRAAHVAMGLIVRAVIVPLAIASLLTGIVVSVVSKWGLVRHYWVVFSLVLTVFATVVLLFETRTVSARAALAADPSTSIDRLSGLGSTLFHSAGGMLVLVVILLLNVYKPRGMTRYGGRKQAERRYR